MTCLSQYVVSLCTSVAQSNCVFFSVNSHGQGTGLLIVFLPSVLIGQNYVDVVVIFITLQTNTEINLCFSNSAMFHVMVFLDGNLEYIVSG